MNDEQKNRLIPWIKNYTRPVNFILGLILGTLLVNKHFWGFIQNWKSEYNQIILDYLRVILNYPSVLLIIFITFFSKFHSSVDYFIRNLRIKYKDVEASSQQVNNTFPQDSASDTMNTSEAISLSKQDAQQIANGIENLQSENQTKQKQIEELQNLVSQLANRSEFFEFQYLNYQLVFNTKVVLKDLYISGPMTRDLFVQNIFVPISVADKIAEKLAIHSALLTNNLIIEEGSIIKVGDKGERYLRHINFI